MARARREMNKKGLVGSDLPAPVRDLESEATKAMAKADYGKAHFAANQLLANIRARLRLIHHVLCVAELRAREDLNLDLAAEYQAVVMYRTYASLVSGPYRPELRAFFEGEIPDVIVDTRFGAVLENVVFDPETRIPDYDNDSKTENTRAAYPLASIPNHVPEKRAGHPSAIVMLTAVTFVAMGLVLAAFLTSLLSVVVTAVVARRTAGVGQCPGDAGQCQGRVLE